MSHELEFDYAGAKMGYVGETPWHGFGKEFPPDATDDQWLTGTRLNTKVEKFPLFAKLPKGSSAFDQAADRYIEVPKKRALLRVDDGQFMDVVSADWKPVQNEEAFKFFRNFIEAGEMSLETAGSLKNGKVVWVLAKTKQGFTINGRDEVLAYLLFTLFHQYGMSTTLGWTAVRTVCWNTVCMALRGLEKNTNQMVRISHRREFVEDEAKSALGFSADRLAKYKEAMEFLSSKRFKDEDVVTYFRRLFCKKTDNKINRRVEEAIALMYSEVQPGVDMVEGTWRHPYETVTFMADHLMSRTADTRRYNAWYGSTRKLKLDALNTAVEMAEVA
jgi:phage/plasmid-like protein (TIGR03299 family)